MCASMARAEAGGTVLLLPNLIPFSAGEATVTTPKPSSHQRTPPDKLGGEVLDAWPDMLFHLNREGRYLAYKPAKGLEPYAPSAEFLGRLIHETLPEAVAAESLRNIEQALATGDVQTYMYDLLLPDGPHSYEARLVPIGEDDVLAIVRDVSAAKNTRAKPEAYSLTKRERVVLSAVTFGLTDKEIGRRLKISPETVHKHVASIRKKMSASSRTEAAVRAVREGLLG